MQALILCQRYTDAQSACQALLPGVDRQYLQAEASWRAGSLGEAYSSLEAFGVVQDSGKCLDLRDLVTTLLQHDRAAATAREEGGLRSVYGSQRAENLLSSSRCLFQGHICHNPYSSVTC